MRRALLRDPGIAWGDVPDLPRVAAAVLESSFSRLTSRVVSASASASGDATKLLVALQDGLRVEAVLMRYESGPAARPRTTLCVSSQVGCQMGCTFCATGTMGLTADLTAGEIVEQLVHARRHVAERALAPLRNVVFMGMGEPLNNYDAVRAALRTATEPGMGFALRRGAVTVSTVGVVPRIRQLAADVPGISLALSLHAPNQELRRRIVPSARAYPLPRLMAAVDDYQRASGRRVFVEYVALGNVNCQPEHARELGELLRGRDVVVNLIPWNPILSPAIAFEAPASGQIAEFARILREEHHLPVTVRQEKGQDVAGACGQLVLLEQAAGGGATCGPGRSVADVEDLGPPVPVEPPR